MEEVIVKNLADESRHLSKIVEWLYSEWGDENYQYWESWVKSSLKTNDVPMTFIAMIGEMVVGTYSLWRCDLQSRQDLFPWFGGLYVEENYRRRGIGKQLQMHAFDRLTELGYKEVYLFTEKKLDYYIRNGWKKIGDAFDEKNGVVSLCVYNL